MARQLDRWAPLGGIIFVILMFIGTAFVADVPDPDAPQQQLTGYLADSANHTRNLIGAYMWVLGALAFLWFVTRLRSVLRGAEGGTGIWVLAASIVLLMRREETATAAASPRERIA